MKYNATHQSSTVQTSSYDTVSLELEVTFIGGATYKYEGVTNEDYRAFVDGESVGKSFNEYIRKYQGQKLLTEINGDDLKSEDNENLLLG
jgi:hypothetical protein